LEDFGPSPSLGGSRDSFRLPMNRFRGVCVLFGIVRVRVDLAGCRCVGKTRVS
jgi:hypothetical protein